MKTRQGGFTLIERPKNCSPRRRVLCLLRQIHLLLWVAILFCSTLLPRNTMADALDNWHVRNSSSNNFSNLIFANDLFVAVSYYQPIMTSPDGVAWTTRPSGTARQAAAIAYGNGRFVVVAAGGVTLTSTDGLNWTSGWSGTSWELRDVTFGNGQFVAVGYGAPLLTSPDGLNWTARDSHGVRGLHVKFGDGKFLVVGTSGTNLLSSNGVIWTPVTARYESIYCMGFGNGTWVVVEIGNNLWISPDAVNWTSHGRLEIVRPSEIHYAYGTWIMVGGKILSSRDGITWTERLSNLSSSGNPLFAVTAGRHTFVAAGYQRILQSDPVLNLEVRRENPRELILSGPLGRTSRLEFSESGAGDWQPLGTVTLDSDPYVWPIESRTATGFYRAVLLEQ